VFRDCEEHRVSFLRGFCEADGSKVKRGDDSWRTEIANAELTSDLRLLAKTCGVKVGKEGCERERWIKAPNSREAVFSKTSSSNFNFATVGQQERVFAPGTGTKKDRASCLAARKLGDNFRLDRVVSVEKSEPCHVWDLTVEGSRSFVCNGFVVHNTRYDDEDHFGIAFSADGVKSLEGIETDSISPSEDGRWNVYFLAGRDKDGVPTTPKVWPDRRMKDYQRTDPIRYAAQVLNNPSLSELNPITREQLRQCIIPAKEVPWSALTFGITTDLALWDGSKQANKDETVYIVWGYSRGGSGDIYFIEGYGSPTWRAEDFAKRLVATVQRYRTQGRRIKGITAEVAMAGVKGAWPIALRSYFHDANESMPPFFEIHRHSTKKELRLGAATSYWVDGHVRLVEGAPGMERLIEQMSRIGQYRVNPRIKIDWADAAADAFVPELYNVMRKAGQSVAPWHPGATGIAIAGLREEDFSDGPDQEWLQTVPRPPLR
jgi:hypothetical protein